MTLQEQLQAAELEEKNATTKIQKIKEQIQKKTEPKTGDVFLVDLGYSDKHLQSRLCVKGILIDDEDCECQEVRYVDGKYKKIFNSFELADLMFRLGLFENYCVTNYSSSINISKTHNEHFEVSIRNQTFSKEGLVQLAAICLNHAKG